MPKLIPLADWAASRYSPPPSHYTLRQWCRNGELPGAERVGREWRVPENARRVSVDAPVRGGLVAQLMGT